MMASQGSCFPKVTHMLSEDCKTKLDWFPDMTIMLGLGINNLGLEGDILASDSYTEQLYHLICLHTPSLEPEKGQVINK